MAGILLLWSPTWLGVCLHSPPPSKLLGTLSWVSPQSPLRVAWDPLGAPWDSLMGPPQTTLRVAWDPLGAPWDPLRAPWSPLRGLLGTLSELFGGPSKRGSASMLGGRERRGIDKKTHLRRLRASWRPPRAPWGTRQTSLRAAWGRLGAFSETLGPAQSSLEPSQDTYTLTWA